MTARSRLGRDPLSGVSQPETKKTAKAATKTTAKKAAPKKSAIPRPTKAGAAPQKTAPAAEPIPPIPQSMPVVEPKAQIDAPMPETVAGPAPAAEPIPPIPQSMPEVEPLVAAATAEDVPEAPTPEPLVETVPTTEAVQPIPQSAPVIEPAPRAVSPESLHLWAPADGPHPHPAEVFLRGVLEGLAPAGGLLTDVEADPDTSALPVEKLFYFSHVLQLLVNPLEQPAAARRKPGDKCGPVPAVSVRLRTIGNGRHSLRIYDNGLFFGRSLPDVSLEMEALRPLLLFVIKRDGSILLKRGKSVEFEIIG
ncbi:hypothetical protein [Solidesulfovibrio sp. C21]|uniref:hypothetical protein n=1 Tax=Solidesulfovibrio sp. C21 TaxID=3398613 RepID=UPI0039FBB85F